jgi:hypothetical protein
MSFQNAPSPPESRCTLFWPDFADLTACGC